MPATVTSRSRLIAARDRSPTRGATSIALVGGMALLLAGLALGFVLASGRAERQGAYEPPVIPGRARPSKARPVAAPAAARPATTSGAVATAAVPSPDGGASPRPDAAAASTRPDPGNLPVAPTRTAFNPGDVGVVVTGPSAASAVLEAERAIGAPIASSPPPTRAMARPAVVVDPDPDAPLGDARAVVLLEADAIRVKVVSPPPLDADPVAALVPPASLVGDVLVDVRLVVGPSRRGHAIAAFAWLLAGRADEALRALDSPDGIAPAKGDAAPAGARILRAYALLLAKELSRVHDEVLGLGTDRDVGPVARLLTGAALLVDGNPREAIRDFSAALAVRPGFWPARLLLGAANDRLALPEAAKDAFAGVLAVVPGRPEAIVGYAPHLATTDRPAAVALVEGLLAERPALVSAWWQLAWLRRTGNTSEDLHREVEAMEHVTALRPDDADAWGALGGARSRWAQSGGGVAAQRGASEAFARQCELAPEDGLAWFNRAATLHQVALETPLEGDASALAPRVQEAGDAYAKALARGLSRTDAARVHFNLGLLLDLGAPPKSGGDARPAGLARTASEAYALALASDPGYAEAGLALAAAHVGARDAKAAATALASLPPGVDPREKAVLEAAIAHVRGDPAGASRLLAGPARTPVVGSDALPPLARELLLLGYRRLVVSLLGADALDAVRLAYRVRARAGLCDVVGTRADLTALRALDAPRADDLLANDADVRRTLGAARR